jgi:hypothetical protein
MHRVAKHELESERDTARSAADSAGQIDVERIVRAYLYSLLA